MKLYSSKCTSLFIQGCGGMYEFNDDEFGSISSPNYPNPYPFNEDCRYVIRSISGKPIILNFTDFHTESFFDFVTVIFGQFYVLIN